jgi:hypothetical protein
MVSSELTLPELQLNNFYSISNKSTNCSDINITYENNHIPKVNDIILGAKY